MSRRNVLALITAVVALGAVVVPSIGVGASGVVTPIKVTVTMSDFKFKLSRTSVPRNKPIVFTVINRGPSPHDWDVTGTKGTPVIAAGKRTTQKVIFKKRGSFRFLCTVPRHAQFGMVGTLRVTG